jgi:HD superfamily phosphohydrolase
VGRAVLGARRAGYARENEPRIGLGLVGASGAEHPDDFSILGEALERLLGEDELAVDGHLEDAASAGFEARLDGEFPLEFGGQPGRLGKVISHLAVFDLHVHPHGSWAGQWSAEGRLVAGKRSAYAVSGPLILGEHSRQVNSGAACQAAREGRAAAANTMSETLSWPYEVRCPVHRSIPFNERERALIDHPLLQRLRAISQLGFAHLVYPGATHTRFSHALGVMHLAGRIFDRIVQRDPAWFREAFPAEGLAYCRQVLRLAGLLHDLGHLPFSHAFEPLLPTREALSLPRAWYRAIDWHARARHEDLSVAMAHTLAEEPGALLSREEAQDACALIHDGIAPTARLTALGSKPARNPYPLLKQIISGEIDADRMDYLPRDAHFAGVTYGFFDLHRLIEGLSCVETERGLVMALEHDALFTYENFLMARFHMAMQVYYHKTLLPFEHFLERAVREGEIAMPFDGSLESFLAAREDRVLAQLFAARERPWSARIVYRRPAARLYRMDGREDPETRRTILDALEAAGIRCIHIREERRVSTLGEDAGLPPILVVENVLGRLRRTPLPEVSGLLRRYNQTFVIERIYCDPQDYERARDTLRRVLEAGAPGPHGA